VKTTKIGRRGTVVIPAKLRKQLGLDEGDLMVAEALNEGVLLRRVSVSHVDERAWGKALLRAHNGALERMRREDSAGWAEYLEEVKEFDGT
jgi:AbrB family looped-hinge helix DNA binding protein